MDYGWLNLMAILLGGYLAWRQEDKKKERRPHDEEKRPARYYWISDRDIHAKDSKVDAEVSTGDGGGGGWDLGGWDD